MKKIVIALGGNALGDNPNDQLRLLKEVSKVIKDLVKDGNRIILTHGNGPQVGQILLAMDEYAKANNSVSMPFAECGSMSQGYIGYQLQQCLQDEFEKAKIKHECVTLVTQVLVDYKDEAFNDPTKPIGKFYDKDEALQIIARKGYKFTEDAGRGYRRVVPSPKPTEIIELNAIDALVNKGFLVICAGGGGIPVVKKDDDELLEGVDAVIDKDMTAALLAREIDADILLILTAVDKVSIGFNTANQIDLDSISVSKAKEYIDNGEFAKGSMLPKIEACIQFVNSKKGKKAIIGSLEKASDCLKGLNGTVIKGG